MSLTRTQRLFLLAGLVLFAFALRVYRLDAMSFWHDEGLTPLRAGYDLAKILSNEIDIQGWATRDTHPPLYYLVAGLGQRLLGSSDFAWRYVPLLFSVLLVPLVAQIGRIMHGRAGFAVGLLAALFVAINPLQVWYAQEARMYTLVVLLMAVATYVLFRALATAPDASTGDSTTAADQRKAIVRWLAAYVVLAGLAFWTHYTAAFLILGQGVFWLWLLWRAGLKKWIVGGAVLAGLLSLPLLPLVTSRLLSDAPETGYTAVPPLVIVQDVVRGFAFGRTVDHGSLLIQFLTVALWGLLLAGVLYRSRQRPWLTRLFLLTYLLATPLGLIVASALFKPMYLGVRHIMVGSPALLLLLTRGVVWLWPRQTAPRAAWRFAAAAAGLFVVICASALALDNFHRNITYAKEDYRGMVAYIDARAGANDVVLYHNALLMPLHAHYTTRDDVPVTALPTYPHGAHPGTIDALRTLFDQHDRVWYMAEPPPDNRDPHDLVGNQIRGRLLPVDERWFHGVNTEMRITAYQSAARGLADLPQGAVAQSWQGDGLPHLRGVALGTTGADRVETLWIELLWDAAAPAPDRGVQLALRAPDGELWVKAVRPFEMDGAPKLPDAPLLRTSYALPLPDGLPPGTYEVAVGAWDSAGQQSLGEWHPAATVAVDGDGVDSAEIARSNGLHFDNGLHLIDVVSTDAVKPGHPLPVTLHWVADEPQRPNLRYQLEVLDAQGDVLRTDVGTVGPAWLQGAEFPVDTVVAQPIGIYFPPETEPGNFSLRWTVLQDSEPVPSHFRWLPWRTDSNLFGDVDVEPWPLITVVEDVDNLVEVVDNQVEGVGKLRAYQHAGDQIALFWEAAGNTPTSYTVFIHVVPSGEVLPATQSDRIPVDWLRPTDGWRAGEILKDIHTLGITQLPPGEYDVYAGFYDPETGTRAPVLQNGAPQPGDQLWLKTITVP